MAKLGYIYVVNEDEMLASDRQWMNQYGCFQVVEDTANVKNLRPMWHKLLDSMERGDELVLSKFSNAVSQVRELTTLIEFCRVKMVRLISINDRIDTKNELFPMTTPADVMQMFGSFAFEVTALRKAVSKINKPRRIIKLEKKAKTSHMDRDKKIVEMYKKNHSLDDIWKASGFNSRSSVFRILNKYGVKLDRGKFRGPLGPRKKKNTEEYPPDL